MNADIYNIPVSNLLIMLVPLVLVGIIYFRWVHSAGIIALSSARMVIQLVLIGFVLVFIFESRSPWMISGILIFMLAVASWISLRPVSAKSPKLYYRAAVSLGVGSFSMLALVVLGVIRLNPWYEPRYLIPVAGMIFSNSMNSISLAAERFYSERERGIDYKDARANALKAALLPMINSCLAVGLVSLPGMMTGQILAGISPLVAVRYQIVVMSMLLGASGLSAAAFLYQEKDS